MEVVRDDADFCGDVFGRFTGLRGLRVEAGGGAFAFVSGWRAGVCVLTTTGFLLGVFAGGQFSLSDEAITALSFALALRGDLALELFGVAASRVARSDSCEIFRGDLGECISSAGSIGSPAVSCSIVSSSESMASKDASKLVDDVLRKVGVLADALSISRPNTESRGPVVGMRQELSLAGDRPAVVPCAVPSTTVQAGS